MSANSTRHAAIILAAGEAKRFGSPKQVLVWKGQTLVEHAVQACLDAGCEQVIVVTGAHKETIELSLKPILHSHHVSLSYNPNWAEGMHTSISCGMKALLDQAPGIKSAIITLVDQPLVDAEFLRKLIEAQQGSDAAALAYPSGPGVPACFSAGGPVGLRDSLFDRLAKLSTKGEGAKAILRDPSLKIALIDDAEKRQDIDTLADWHDFTNR